MLHCNTAVRTTQNNKTNIILMLPKLNNDFPLLCPPPPPPNYDWVRGLIVDYRSSEMYSCHHFCFVAWKAESVMHVQWVSLLCETSVSNKHFASYATEMRWTHVDLRVKWSLNSSARHENWKGLKNSPVSHSMEFVKRSCRCFWSTGGPTD
jgi:hypothetical protein